jgi:hypothetical protein
MGMHLVRAVQRWRHLNSRNGKSPPGNEADLSRIAPTTGPKIQYSQRTVYRAAAKNNVKLVAKAGPSLREQQPPWQITGSSDT